MNLQNKLATIIFFISLVLPLILFYGSVDDFGPRHMANINEVSSNGHLSQYDEDLLPGYYAYGGIISLICGISGKDLLFMPIQLIPFAVSFFLLMNCLSRNYLFASVATITELITGITGSPKIYFWPHGIGFTLFFLLLAIFLRALEQSKSKLSIYILISIIIGSSLAFLSYDLFFMAILFLGLTSALFFLDTVLKTNSNSKDSLFYSRKFFAIFTILLIVELGLSKFFYNTFFEIFFHTQYIEISGIDKLLMSFFENKSLTNPIDNILLKYPSTLTLLYIVKYFILSVSILAILSNLLRKLTKYVNLDLYDIFTLAVIFTSLFYSIARLRIGQNPITYLYTPGIICSVLLYQFHGKFKSWALFVILSLFFISTFSYYIMDKDDLLNKDEGKFSYLEMPSSWYIDHGNLNVSCDELSRGFFLLYSSERGTKLSNKGALISRDELIKKIKVISTKDAQFLRNESTESLSRQSYIINYNLNSMNLQNWMIIKSWEYSKGYIESNKRINKIYDISSVSIYSS